MYNSEACVDCPLGYYASTAQEDSCFSCGEGFYTGERLKATNCIACDAGTFSIGLSMNCTEWWVEFRDFGRNLNFKNSKILL